MPEICRFYGIIIKMFFDDHNPPHFHVEYNDCKAIVEINSGTITGRLPRRALTLVYDWLDLHRDELLRNWEESKTTGKVFTIMPLE